MSDISPEYDECPTFCFKNSAREEDFCDTCEVKIAKDIFKEETIQILNDRVGDTWKVYTLDELIQAVNAIVNMEDDDRSTWSPASELLYEIYLGQKNRLKRVEDWNHRQKMKRNKDGD